MFVMKLEKSSPKFSGILYGQKCRMLSKPVYTCKYGDRLLVSTFVDAVNNGADVLIKKEPGFNKIVLESDLDIKFNLCDRIKFLISDEQIEMLKKKKEGEYDTLIYVLSDDDYINLKNKNSKSFQAKLAKFRELIHENAPIELRGFINTYFN